MNFRNRFASLEALGTPIALSVVVVTFCVKYMSNMLLNNSMWRSGAWYEFLADTSPTAQAGLLDPVAMASYYKTMSVSAGHRLVASVNSWLGFESGTAFLYVVIASLLTASIYYLALHLTGSKLKAFVIAFILLNSDVLAMAHIGAAGSSAQGPTRDHLALGFFLFGLYFLLKHRLVAYTACLYVGFLLHLTHGVFAFLLFLPLTFYQTRSIRFILFHGGVFALTALGLYAFQATGAVPISADIQTLWFSWVYIFNGGHIFFDHSIGYLVPNYAYFALVLAGVAVSLGNVEHRRIALSVVPVWVVIACVGTVFIYVVPTMLGHQLTPYRSSLTVSAVLLILLSSYVINRLSEEVSVLERFLALVSLIALISGTFLGVAVGAVAACTLLWRGRSTRTRVALVCAGIAALALSSLLAMEYRIYDAQVVARDTPWWLVILASLLVVTIARFFKPALFSAHLVAIVPCALVVLTLAVVPSRYVSAPSAASLEKIADYIRASEVVAENSNADTPILTAPLISMPMLEVTAGRGSVLQLVKSHVPYMAPHLLPRFDEALKSFGVDIGDRGGSWIDIVKEAPLIWRKQVTTTRAIELGKQFHTPLLLTYEDHALDMPKLYSGPHFTVYELPK
jgi:hypothetical protein